MDPRPVDSFIVMNGDLITELDFKALAEFHRKEKNEITVCVRRDKVSIPYGVVTVDGDDQRIHRLEEKPDHEFLVNAGIYMLEPGMIDLIPPTGYFDMTSLINEALNLGKRVGAFAVIEYWRDIGRHQEMERATEEWQQRRKSKTTIQGSVPAYLF